jgi:hypothetical protein
MASPTSPPAGTQVSISATLDYNGTPISINSGDIAQLEKGNFNFTLTQPVDLGSLDDFIDWLNKEFGVPITSAEVENLAQFISIPALRKAFNHFLSADISITTVVINTTTQVYELGVTFTPEKPVELFGDLKFDSIGVLVTHGKGITSP